MKDDSEYIACTLGLTLEDNVVNYIVPAASAHLEGSVQVGDRIVAGMEIGRTSLELVHSFGCPACHTAKRSGDRIAEACPNLAVDGIPVDANSVVDAIVRNERVGNICSLTLER